MATPLPLRRLLLGGFVVAVLAALIWLLGPRLGSGEPPYPLEPWSVRLLLILALLALWAGTELLLRLLARRREQRMLAALAAPSEADVLAQQESERLRQRFAEAMAQLQRGRGGAGASGALLYELPWYMFIGAPGSGKTTALVHSGLRFPLAPPGAAAQALAGVGGTRNCDWWFTEQAVLIDTAGRYLTQDSHAEVDQRAWHTFLNLLKTHRPRQPINGAIVTLSVQDLLQDDGATRSRYAQQVRSRIDELQQVLGLQFPIYLMVTKTDLVPGFTPFFASYGPEQRAQVWGASFDYDLATRQAPPARQAFEPAFAGLVERLNRQLLQRLQDERDTDQRVQLYAFAQQFAQLGPLIAEFLEQAFGDSRFAQPVALRGVYFTSGTQYGAPIDRLLHGLAHTLDLGTQAVPAPAAASAKSFFIQRLLAEVVFGEAGLAGHSEAREQRLRRIAWGSAAALGLVGTLWLTGMLVSALHNRSGLQRAQAASDEAAQGLAQVGAPSVGDLAPVVDALDAVQRIAPAVHDPVDAPTLDLRFGLYQGQGVADEVDVRYRLALQRALLPRMALQLEAVLAAPQAGADAQYAALKTYLMLYDARRLHAPWLMAAMDSLWRATGHDPLLVQRARRHLQALVDGGDLRLDSFHARQDALVDSARARIAATPLVERLAAQLRLLGQGEGPRLSEALGPAGEALLQRRSGIPLSQPVPAVYTGDGYRQLVKPQLAALVAQATEEQDWVMGQAARSGAAADAAALQAEVLRRYFVDMEEAWQAALADLQLKPLASLREAQSAAQVLASSRSPLRGLVDAVARHTRVGQAADLGAAAAQAAQDNALRQASERATALAGSLFGAQTGTLVQQAAPKDLTRQLEQQFEQRFSDFRRLAGDGKPGDIDKLTALLAAVASELSGLQQKLAGGQGVRELPATLAQAESLASAEYPVPIPGLVRDLVALGKGSASAGLRAEVKAGVGGAAALCRRAVAGRYPFSRGAAAEVGVQDFVAVFRSGGDLDAYFNANLAPLVDKSGPVWRLKASGDGVPPVPPATLQQFQQAEAIRNAFLAAGSTAQVQLDLTLVSADADVQLDYDGSSHALKPGAALRLAWPANPGVRLSVGGAPVVQADGAWALFRLLDRGQGDGSGGDRLRLWYSAPGGARALLEWRSDRAAYNPLRLPELRRFSCP